jgi:hypothetical protein
MKRLLTLFCLSLFVVGAHAQVRTCTPNPAIPDTLFGVFPLPYDPATSPNGGIRDTACLNKPYEFVFTAVVGATIKVGTIAFPLDSVRLPVTGGVGNLPTGLTYNCNPGNCVFKSNTKGCVVIFGTVTDPAKIGDYNLTISAQAFVNSSPQPLSIVFPSPLIAAGTYVLSVRPQNFSNCKVASDEDVLETLISLKNVPNPFTGSTEFIVSSQVSEDVTLTVRDLFGRTLHTMQVPLLEGVNSIHFDGAGLPNGYYIYSLSNERGSVSSKLMIAGR